MNALIPYLSARNAARAVEFYEKAFGATSSLRIEMPDGKLGHIELSVGDAQFYLADEFPEIGCEAPAEGRGVSVTLHLVVDDADAFIAKAVAAGARVTRAPKDEFYGLRMGTIEDPFGHRWMIGHYLEKLTEDEILERAEKLMKQGGEQGGEQ